VSFDDLPLVNAILNGITTALLILGFIAIKQNRAHLHRNLMVTAFCTSSLFLLFYVAHKIYKQGEHTVFTGEGPIRVFYYIMLASHILLAIVNLPMILRLIYLAVKGRFRAHRRLARWTYPIWMYVSVTGVLVYLFLYQWFPAD
jgi:putative membrane protein